MRKIKLVAIHLADMFDHYVLHYVASYFDETDGKFGDWVFNMSDKICTKIVESKWWGDELCDCFYCIKYHADID